MWLIASVICAFISIVFYINEKRLYSPTGFMGALYAVICFLSGLHLYGMYSYTDKVYIFIVMGMLFFAVGARAGGKLWFKIPKADRTINYNIYWIFAVIGLILSIWYSMSAIQMLMSGRTLDYIYQMHMASNDTTNIFGHSLLENVLLVYVLMPISYLLIPASVCMYFMSNKVKYLVVSVLLVTFRVIYHGGRAIIFFELLYLVFVYIVILQNKELKESVKFERPHFTKRQKMVIAVVLIGGFVFAQNMTKGRGELNLGQHLYTYLTGCVPNFALRLDDIKAIEPTWGFESLRGFFYPIFSLSEKLFSIRIPIFDYTEEVFNYFQQPISIAPGKQYNAFVTAFCFFYVDGRIIGIIIGSFILGFSSQKSFLKLEWEPSLFTMTVYSIMFVNVLFYSFNTCMFSYIQIAWALILSVVLFSGPKKVIIGKFK